MLQKENDQTKIEDTANDASRVIHLGYPSASFELDINSKLKEETEIDPENITEKKSSEIDLNGTNEKNYTDDYSASDLDIPGSELDDDDEAIGSEDEENNHYSLGGDNHNDLDEDY